MKITIKELWNDDFKDKSSEHFRELALSLKKGIEEIYDAQNNEDTTILAQVVEVR
jgi:hypothetical protein